jgi:hypothetical protein
MLLLLVNGDNSGRSSIIYKFGLPKREPRSPGEPWQLKLARALLHNEGSVSWRATPCVCVHWGEKEKERNDWEAGINCRFLWDYVYISTRLRRLGLES